MSILRRALGPSASAWGWLLLIGLAPIASGQAVQQAPAIGRIVGFEDESNQPFAVLDADLSPAPFAGPARFQPRPLRLTARDAVDRACPDLAQETADLGGIPSVTLPDGSRLLRYRRSAAGVAGIFQVDRQGRVRVLIERAIVGGQAPFRPWIAVSPHEPVAAIATNSNINARGDVYLLRLDGGNFPNGTAAVLVSGSLPLADVEPRSLTFASGALFGVHADNLLIRVPDDGSTDAVVIPLPLSGGQTPVETCDELAVSADGSTLVLLAGQTEKVWDLYVVTAAGVVSNLTANPSEYQPPGHWPDPAGPFLALSPDGAHVVYADESPDLEYFRRDTAGVTAPIQLTPDSLFEQSIDDGSSVISRSRFVMINLGADASSKDTYEFTFQAGGAVSQVANLTRTSGDVGVPWNTGAVLAPVQVLASANADSILLVDDRSWQVGAPTFDLWTVGATGSRLQAVDLEAPPVALLPRNDPERWVLHWADAAGPRLGTLDADPTAPANVLLTGIPGFQFAALSAHPAGSEAGLVASSGPGSSTVLAVNLSSGVIRFLSPFGGFAGTQTRYSPAGNLLFSFGFTPILQGYVELPSGAVAPITGATGTPRFY